MVRLGVHLFILIDMLYALSHIKQIWDRDRTKDGGVVAWVVLNPFKSLIFFLATDLFRSSLFYTIFLFHHP